MYRCVYTYDACLYNSSMIYYTYFKQLNDQLLLIAVTSFVYMYIRHQMCVCEEKIGGN